MDNTQFINCRQCPGKHFDLAPVLKASFGPARFIAICHAKEMVLNTIFETKGTTDHYSFINKANIATVNFEPIDNCPFLEEMREQKLIPSCDTIDFLNK